MCHKNTEFSEGCPHPQRYLIEKSVFYENGIIVDLTRAYNLSNYFGGCSYELQRNLYWSIVDFVGIGVHGLFNNEGV
jgi:hypothetical protein